MSPGETIFARATGGGRAPVSIIRLSGPGTKPIIAALVGRVPEARRATLRMLRDAAGVAIDQALVLWFPAPASFTGEDCAELHVHGGAAVLAAVSAALIGQGARPAEAGEFSRRAFYNGKLDLLQAEGIADLIDAETEAQRRVALDQAGGAMQALSAEWRGRLIRLMAQQTALIDFSNEDLPDELDDALAAELADFIEEVDAALQAGEKTARLREGLDFVVLGVPNAGKSTLVNAIAGEEVAIVSETPGTTRDAIGVRVALGGVPVRLLDTAGLRDTADAIELEGVRRARAHGAQADLVILAAAAPEPEWPEVDMRADGLDVLRIVTKSDLAKPGEPGHNFAKCLAVSARTGAGMEALRAALAGAARRLTDAGAAPALGRPRQIACMRDIRAALARARLVRDAELRAEELQIASTALARLTGVIGIEDVLDEVFGNFCIGK